MCDCWQVKNLKINCVLCRGEKKHHAYKSLRAWHLLIPSSLMIHNKMMQLLNGSKDISGEKIRKMWLLISLFEIRQNSDSNKHVDGYLHKRTFFLCPSGVCITEKIWKRNKCVCICFKMKSFSLCNGKLHYLLHTVTHTYSIYLIVWHGS